MHSEFSKDFIDSLIELERKGLEATSNEDYKLAATYFTSLVNLNPNFEHGMAYYNLADALDEMGDTNAAEEAYLKALDYDATDTIRLGGYASFLSRYRSPLKSFKVYLDLLRVAKSINDLPCIEGCLYSLFSLGDKMGWDKKEVYEALKANCLEKEVAESEGVPCAYRDGITAFLSDDYLSAEALFRKVLNDFPGIDKGMSYCYLANSLWAQGRVEESRAAFLNSLESDSRDIVRLGYYAFFTEAEFEPKEAFSLYLKMLKLSREQNLLYWDSIAIYHLKNLGEKMGWSEEEVQKTIDEA